MPHAETIPLAPLLLVIGCSMPVMGQPPVAGELRRCPAGSESLIGETLDDSFIGSLSDWRIEDGTLIGTADGSLTTNRFIVSKTPAAADFEIEVDVWISAAGNSGLQYRSEWREDLGPAVMVGYQCDVVAATPAYNGMLYEERGRRILCYTGQTVVMDPSGQGWVIDQTEPTPIFEPERWHRYRIEVRGNHHRHWIDDQRTAEFFDLDLRGRRLEGQFGVQVHVGPPMEVRYRNFFLTRLPDTRPPVTRELTPDAEKIVPQGGWARAGDRDSNAKLQSAELPDTVRVWRAGSVWLSSQPSEAALRELADRGLAKVITLRKAAEMDFDDAARVQGLGLEFQPLRFGGHKELTPAIFDAARTTLKSAGPGREVLLHCASTNRVGAIWLAHRVLDGRQAIPEARAEARRVGLVDPALEQAALDYIASKQPAPKKRPVPK